jgi:type I restriction enzyme S subunit
MEKQRELAKVLWAIDVTKRAYQHLLQKTDELVKAQFIEIFGDLTVNDKQWPIKPFSEFAKIDATMTTEYVKYANYPHIGIDSIESVTGRLNGYRTVAQDGVKSAKYIFSSNHIIYSKIRPNLNKAALPTFSGLCSADAYPILSNNEICDKVFLAYILRSEFFLSYILPLSQRTNMPKVNREQISGFKMPLPPLDLQLRFVEFVRQSYKSKFELEQALAELIATYKKIISENLG